MKKILVKINLFQGHYNDIRSLLVSFFLILLSKPDYLLTNIYIMEKVILDTEYAVISHNSELKLGKIVWKRKTSTEEYQYAFITLLEYAKIHPTDNFLSDIRNQSVVSPENRKWFEEEMLPKAIDTGLKRAGVIFDGNIFKKYYINMIIKVSNKFGMPLKMFSTEKEAIEWFKSQK